MKNIYHSDIYQFNTPVSSYWEDHSSENLNLDKVNKDISSEIVFPTLYSNMLINQDPTKP